MFYFYLFYFVGGGFHESFVFIICIYLLGASSSVEMAYSVILRILFKNYEIFLFTKSIF